MHDQAVPTHKRESTDDRRIAIALAARALIVEKGFEGLRTRDIAERVGINIATLHYHVPSKEALIGLVTQSMHDEFHAQGLRHPRQGLTPLECLRIELSDYRETIAETPELVAVFAELLGRAVRDKKVRDVIGSLHDSWMNQFVDIFSRGRDDGTFRPDIDPEAAALIFTGALKGAFRAPDGLNTFDRLAAELLRAVLSPVSNAKETAR